MTEQQPEPILQIPRLWRVTRSLSGKQVEPRHADVLALRPLVDEHGTLFFIDRAGHVQMIFAPGTWQTVQALPLRPPPEQEEAGQ